MYLVYTWSEHDLNKFVHEHLCKNKNMYVCVHARSEHGVNCVCTWCIHYIDMVIQCIYMFCALFIQVHPVSYQEHAKPFCAIIISFKYAIHTRLYQL